MYLINLIHLEGRMFDDNPIYFHRLEPLKVDVADPLMPQLDVCLDLETLGIHG
jgi:hypothetical protein